MRVETFSPEETIALGSRLAEHLAEGSVVALYGPLGSGKTCLIKGICQGLGVTQEVTSPTFTLMNIYEGRLPVFHFDFFRIERVEEIAELGVEEFFFDEGVSVIEWAEKAAPFLPGDRVDIFLRRASKITPDTENYREIEIRGLEESL